MMYKPFEDIVKETIAFHAAEIARLERALLAYVDADNAMPSVTSPPRIRLTEDAKQRHRVSKYEPLFKVYEAERRPLSNDDMIRIAAENGFHIDRSNMRSIVYTQKSLRRVRPVGDRYVWGMELTSFPEGESGGLTPPANYTNQPDGDAQQHEGADVDRPGVGGI